MEKNEGVKQGKAKLEEGREEERFLFFTLHASYIRKILIRNKLKHRYPLCNLYKKKIEINIIRWPSLNSRTFY